MGKISKLYFLIGCLIGAGLFLAVVAILPDGKLHIVFCDVGQGDAIYIRTPSNIDLLIDGGPNDKVLSCLGRFMPFYDRTIDIVVLTHPQKDHLQGLISVIKRYNVNYFLSTPVSNSTEGYVDLFEEIKRKNVSVYFPVFGNQMKLGEVELKTLWPDRKWLAEKLIIPEQTWLNSQNTQIQATDIEINDFSIYLFLQYFDFSLLLTGDGDIHVQQIMESRNMSDTWPKDIDVLKVPHHGSKNGMLDNFINHLKAKLSIIEVGKNSYGHPSAEIISKLEKYGKVVNTQEKGDIEIISDGKYWKMVY